LTIVYLNFHYWSCCQSSCLSLWWASFQ